MHAMRNRRALAALLALLVAMAGVPGPARAQDERPDLKIEIVGLDPNDPTKVRVRVTNVGKWWADHTTATVETTAPTRGNKVEEDVPDLDPKQEPQGPTDYKYEFTYRLAAACQPGLKVTASLSIAKTFNGNQEAAADVTNNLDEREPCPNAVPPGGVGGVGLARGPAPAEKAATQEEIEAARWVKPGQHIRVLDKPSVKQRHGIKQTNKGHLGCLPDPGDILEGGTGLMVAGTADVGYRFIDGFGCDVNYVWQLVVNFDLEWLRSVDRKLLGHAELQLAEVASARNNDGEPIPATTCIGKLGLALPNWRDATNPENPSLLVTEEAGPRQQPDGLTLRSWNVTQALQRPINRDYPALAGFVLHGLNENLDAESEAACASTISTVVLRLEYAVGQ